jgi:DNA-directed RNA polymerase subunit M/transcription elongation factor TFIIS
MPIDPTGTNPQAVPQVEEPKELNVKCRRPNCDSITAVQVQIAPAGGGQRLYRCTKCGHMWGLNVGGHLDI